MGGIMASKTCACLLGLGEHINPNTLQGPGLCLPSSHQRYGTHLHLKHHLCCLSWIKMMFCRLQRRFGTERGRPLANPSAPKGILMQSELLPHKVQHSICAGLLEGSRLKINGCIENMAQSCNNTCWHNRAILATTSSFARSCKTRK